MDLSSFRMNKTDDSTFKHNYQMLTLLQLSRSIDSIHKINASYVAQAARKVNNNMKFSDYIDSAGWDKIDKDTSHSKYLLTATYATDSIRKLWTKARHDRDSIDKTQAARDKEIADAAKKAPPSHPTSAPPPTPPGHPTIPTPIPHPIIPVPGGQAVNRLATLTQPPPLVFEDLLPDSVRSNVMEHANTVINNAKVSVDQPVVLYNNEVDNLRQHEIAWHEKLTLAVAVLVMFLIGAPLGSIIRKGGIGLPLVFAVVFFVIFFLLNNFGKKFVKEGVLGPVGGMWMATYVLTPIGLFLTYKAMHDSQLFNKESYYRMGRSIRKFIQKIRSKRQAAA
jgi:hypothetical protein